MATLLAPAQGASASSDDGGEQRGDGAPGEGHAFSLSAVPTLTFSTDEGFGTGGVATVFHRHGGVTPYRDAVTFNLFISSKLVQAHAITWDALKPFDLEGRLLLRLAYYATVSQNYCGLGNGVTCAEGDASNAARAAGLVDGSAAFEDFVRRYHLMRFLRPSATVLLRPWLRDKPWRVELLLGWRAAWQVPGDLFERGPYPGSLFARDFPTGQAGVTSNPTVGVIVDDRDTEAFPTRGFLAEASLRVAHPWLGYTTTWAAATASGAWFWSLVPRAPADPQAPRLVLATRVLGDVMLGDPTVEEMARIGGTVDAIVFGGFQVGRGVREHRFVGALKAAWQTELRAQIVDTVVFGERFNHGFALFSDVGWLSRDVDELLAGRGRPLRLLSGAGLSYRVLWNDDFAIRWDLAVSPDEAAGPGMYIIVGNTF